MGPVLVNVCRIDLDRENMRPTSSTPSDDIGSMAVPAVQRQCGIDAYRARMVIMREFATDGKQPRATRGFGTSDLQRSVPLSRPGNVDSRDHPMYRARCLLASWQRADRRRKRIPARDRLCRRSTYTQMAPVTAGHLSHTPSQTASVDYSNFC